MVYGKIFRLCALEFCLGGIKDYTLDGDGLDFFLDAFFFKKLVEGGTAVVGRFAIFFVFILFSLITVPSMVHHTSE